MWFNNNRLVLLSACIFVLAASTAQASKSESASALSNRGASRNETSIGSLVSDALREYLHADVAIVAASDIKSRDSEIPAGRVNSADVISLIAYPDDTLALMELTGSTLRAALEKGLSIYPQPSQAFLQVSGLKFTFDPSKKPGSRVASISIGNTPIDDSATYKVAATTTIANGALGYWKVWPQEAIRKRFPDDTLTKAIEAYFQAKPTLNYSVLDRIVSIK